jgi:hypothetical protein
MGSRHDCKTILKRWRIDFKANMHRLRSDSNRLSSDCDSKANMHRLYSDSKRLRSDYVAIAQRLCSDYKSRRYFKAIVHRLRWHNEAITHATIVIRLRISCALCSDFKRITLESQSDLEAITQLFQSKHASST